MKQIAIVLAAYLFFQGTIGNVIVPPAKGEQNELRVIAYQVKQLLFWSFINFSSFRIFGRTPNGKKRIVCILDMLLIFLNWQLVK